MNDAIRITRRADSTFQIEAPGTDPIIVEKPENLMSVVGQQAARLPVPTSEEDLILTRSGIADEVRRMRIREEFVARAIDEALTVWPSKRVEFVKSLRETRPDWFQPPIAPELPGEADQVISDTERVRPHKIDTSSLPAGPRVLPDPEPLPWNERLNALTLQKNPEGDFVLTGPRTYKVIPVAEAMHGDRLFEEFLPVVAQLLAEPRDEHVDFTPLPCRLENQGQMIQRYQEKRERGEDKTPLVECIECRTHVSKWEGEKAPVCLPCLEIKRLRGMLAEMKRQRDALLEMTWLDTPDEPHETIEQWKEKFRQDWVRRNDVASPAPRPDHPMVEETRARVSKRVWGPGDEYFVVEVQTHKFKEGTELHVTLSNVADIGPKCDACGWCNTGCLNVGESGKPFWICHGCIKREHDMLKAKLLRVTFGGGTIGMFAFKGEGVAGIHFVEAPGRQLIGSPPAGERRIKDAIPFLRMEFMNDEAVATVIQMLEHVRRKFPLPKADPATVAPAGHDMERLRTFVGIKVGEASVVGDFKTASKITDEICDEIALAGITLRQHVEELTRQVDFERSKGAAFAAEVEEALTEAEKEAGDDRGVMRVCSVAYRILWLSGNVKRLKKGEFTPAEFQNLCHNLPGHLSPEKFSAGCEAYHMQLFGRSPIGELREKLTAFDAIIERAKNCASHIIRIATVEFENGKSVNGEWGPALDAIRGWGEEIIALAAERVSVSETAKQIAALTRESRERGLLCERAWGIIANAHGGNWEQASGDWQQAAANWRDEFHNKVGHL